MIIIKNCLLFTNCSFTRFNKTVIQDHDRTASTLWLFLNKFSNTYSQETYFVIILRDALLCVVVYFESKLVCDQANTLWSNTIVNMKSTCKFGFCRKHFFFCFFIISSQNIYFIWFHYILYCGPVFGEWELSVSSWKIWPSLHIY